MGDSERENGVQEFSNVNEEDETWNDMKHDSSRGKESISLVKRLTHSGSGVLPECIFSIVTGCVA